MLAVILSIAGRQRACEPAVLLRKAIRNLNHITGIALSISWQAADTCRGETQMAYQVLVASSAGRLAKQDAGFGRHTTFQVIKITG
jgi:hypothetical protein